ncbi:hypothetical protein ACU4GR_33880 (plasmid) [Methylobacterium oryzae CBMB20]
MNNRFPWFRCFAGDMLDAIAGLDPDEGYVYSVVIWRIYEAGGPVSDNARTLSRRTGLPERRVAKALSELIEAGRLSLTAENRLDSATTHAEIEWQKARQKDQSAAGKASAAKRQNWDGDKKNGTSVLPDDASHTGKDQQNQRKDATAVERPFNQGEGEGERDKGEGLGATIEPTVPHPKNQLLIVVPLRDRARRSTTTTFLCTAHSA